MSNINEDLCREQRERFAAMTPTERVHCLERGLSIETVSGHECGERLGAEPVVKFWAIAACRAAPIEICDGED